MKTPLTPAPSPRKPSRRLWVGLAHKTHARTVFRFAGEPTAESCPEYVCAIGPFRTRRGADYMARFGGNNNPHCRSVADAERLAAFHAGQSERCAAYAAHLDKQIRAGG